MNFKEVVREGEEESITDYWKVTTVPLGGNLLSASGEADGQERSCELGEPGGSQATTDSHCQGSGNTSL